MRWVAGSGRPASVLNDTLLIDWVHDLSNGSYRPPERKLAARHRGGARRRTKAAAASHQKTAAGAVDGERHEGLRRGAAEEEGSPLRFFLL